MVRSTVRPDATADGTRVAPSLVIFSNILFQQSKPLAQTGRQRTLDNPMT
jgi:hypothetical protein